MHRAYVVRLSRSAARRGPSTKPNLYVGETSLTPERRFAIHKAGGPTASTVVTRYGYGLAPEFYSHLPPFRTRLEAEGAEKQLRQELIDRGHNVFGGVRGISEAWFMQSKRSPATQTSPTEISELRESLEGIIHAGLTVTAAARVQRLASLTNMSCTSLLKALRVGLPEVTPQVWADIETKLEELPQREERVRRLDLLDQQRTLTERMRWSHAD